MGGKFTPFRRDSDISQSPIDTPLQNGRRIGILDPDPEYPGSPAGRKATDSFEFQVEWRHLDPGQTFYDIITKQPVGFTDKA
jgi:hypothetical protein